MLYLAFGANMSRRKLLERGATCPKPGIPVKGTRASWCPSATGAALRPCWILTGSSKAATPLPLKTTPKPESALGMYPCHGVIYQVLQREGCGGWPRERLATVELMGMAVMSHDGRWHKAEAFVSQPSLLLKAPCGSQLSGTWG